MPANLAGSVPGERLARASNQSGQTGAVFIVEKCVHMLMLPIFLCAFVKQRGATGIVAGGNYD